MTATPTTPAYHFNVKMTCGGCSGAITRVLTKNIEQPNAFHVSLPAQQVLIWGPTLPDFDDITKKIEKAGKEIRSKGIILEEGKLPELRAAA